MAIHALTVPKWGIEMQEATLAEWRVEAGTAIAKGDEVVDLETDKIVNTHEAPAAGVLRRRIGEPGDVYDVGALIGVIADGDESDADIDAFIDGFVPVDASFDGGDDTADEVPDASRDEAPKAAAPASAGGDEPRISPIAKRLAESLGVDWTGIDGTGRNGRISKQDVEAAAERQAGGQPVARTSLAKTMAERMTAAKQSIPHFYLEIAIGCDWAQELRAAYNRDNDARVTLNDLLIKATARALADNEAIDVVWRDGELYRSDGGIGVAIASKHGLVAPVVADAANASLAVISDRVRELAKAADERSLTKADFDGAATTVSNLGMFGIDRFDAIINPPQTSILAVGRAVAAPAVNDDGEVAVTTSMRLTMSCDHRAFDGATGARYLSDLKGLVEAPEALFD